MIEALEEIPLGDILGDGAYDTTDCREAINDQGGKQVIPSDKGAKLQKGKLLLCLKARAQAIQRIQKLGRKGVPIGKKRLMNIEDLE